MKIIEMLKKVTLALLIGIFVVPVNIAIGQNLKADECSARKLECECFLPPALDIISSDLIKYEKCKVTRDSYIKTIDELKNRPAATSWWQEPTYIAGGLALSFSLGGYLVWAIVD